MGNTITKEHSTAPTTSVASSAKKEQCQRDFGPCGKLVMALNETNEQGPGPEFLENLFGLEACLKQHLQQNKSNDPEQKLKMETMLLTFGEPDPSTPPFVTQTRERMHNINWTEKIREFQ
jgi:hypothetical protein